MGRKQKVYLSLGSNLGNRLANLQKAIFRIEKGVGKILDISSVYENPAMGFEGDQFLNIVISLLTPFNPKELLNVLLQIEKEFGRIRSAEGGYSSRTLDIDIIYFGSEVINNDDLVVPHPQMQHRNFVLKPLGDIAPQFYHPVLYKDTRNLLQECKDNSRLSKTKHKLFKNRSGLFSQLQLIAIEGNIGAGKTTLSKMIGNDFNAKLVLERFADNPFLPKFYEDQARYAFPLEMSFLADRYQQFMDDTSQFDLFKNFMVSDYDIFKSLIFAKITLQKEEYNLYRKVFSFMYKEVRKPEIYLYLYQNTERLLANIKKRGRDYEQNIDPVYLEKINRGYLDFIKGNPNQNSVIVDMGELDFVHNPVDYEFILKKLEDNILSLNI
ncbi:2-amino-4-hydroxy-6-hydroxymethyldihydropteridine diphosphokinase [Flagellimonas halotolerans]|uniref:2-amino-4-hydroxy-6-hydroxymethyldihydropteridine pyrophosphokinase n=1 Tax=Flagellimonas halotolerans TaxID=3112164 RepID=A0ABU6IUM7_9FLAO|nr:MULTISPECIES: 2-amino-4-hydroxy-6-hydroxymethyldihydropteridine diphosphokinase [unclassified Allomuricauda]MEC3966798.1 2-amino-4-hydroxy-6-hydroxymethyldihydropteridine diphosphokinase [Muricauda sp. SYSU M86414]MEC4266686.1 2-amino-4-hydroxy-6-hydroxymethyldihydropteridine diphosphokinase [Muricauda sp. SYSU M84420]